MADDIYIQFVLKNCHRPTTSSVSKEVWLIFVQLGYKPSGKTLAYKIYTALQYEYNKAMKSVCLGPK